MKWEMRTVSELCLFATDCVNKTAPVVDYKTPYKMIRTNNVKGGFIDLENVRHVDEETFDKWTRRSKPQYGDVILTREAPVGDVGRFTSHDENVFLGQRLFHYRPNPECLDWRYLAYVLQSDAIQAWVNGIAFGATVPHIKVADAENIQIPCPPIEIQRKIGATLAAYDDLIENNLKRIKLLEEMSQITYEEWFVRMKFPGHESVVINPKTGIPQGWKTLTCYDVMNVLSGGTPKTDVSEYWGGDIDFYTPKDAENGIYTRRTEKQITEKGLKKCNSKLYPKNTLFITARGTVGKLNLADKPMAMNQSCYALQAKEGISQFFLYCSTLRAIDAFKGAANGGVFDTIVVDTFKYLPFIKPNMILIDDFTKKITPAFDTVFTLLRQNELLREARDILLPRLMTGMIDIDQVEVPEVLLQRVSQTETKEAQYGHSNPN